MWAERVEGESKQTCVNADVGRGWPSGGVRARLRLSRARGLPWAVTLPPAQRTQRREVTGKGPWALEVLPESPARIPCFEELSFGDICCSFKGSSFGSQHLHGNSTTYSANCRGSDALLWSPWEPGTQVVLGHVQAQHHTQHKINGWVGEASFT